MDLRGWSLITWVFLAVLANPARMFAERFNIPNASIPLREAILYGLLAASLPISRAFKRPVPFYALFVFLVFATVYVVTSAYQDKHLEGLYFLRIYMTPFLFFLCALIWLEHANNQSIETFCRLLLWLNGFIVVGAIALYAAMQAMPFLVNVIFGVGRLVWSWYIAGGVMRLGLPFAAPNSMGTYAALSILLIVPLLLSESKIARREPLLALIVLNVIALALSFSRSSMVTLVVGLGLIASIPGVITSKSVFKIFGTLTVGVVILVAGIVVVDIANDGLVEKWLNLNTSMRDPSMQGHLSSVVEAIDNFDEYFLNGYARGTVGPRGQLFTTSFIGVENSVLGVLFDMGLPCGALFFLAWGILVGHAYTGVLQRPILLAFLVNLQFLPYVFEPEVIAYFVCIFGLLGALQNRALLNFGVSSGKRVSSETKPSQARRLTQRYQ